MSRNFYYENTKSLKTELKKCIEPSLLKELHHKVWWKHFIIFFRQIFLMITFSCIAIQNENIFIWSICSLAIGFIVFSWNPLLHEVLHGCVFNKKHSFLENCLGYFYAMMGGLSKTQFTHWHLKHHEELGSNTEDPKRAFLTPKIVKRWYKFLYFTPALFFIYFYAAHRETQNYCEKIKRQIQWEKLFLFLFHAIFFSCIVYYFEILGALKVYLIPYFIVFPIAFTINRLGQHYSIDPEDSAHWTTLIESTFFWNTVYLYSNLHLEHHYFPKVPCYNLPKLQKLLKPLYEKHNIKPQYYFQLLWGWLVKNKAPHTNWQDDLHRNLISVKIHTDSKAYGNK